ncbi:hypothetical protein NPIL_667791 [Nephila pilipes]|uniref:Uncharacterized protein n=1 Tax=Nephila pilipes TaxID=299642 RepID=A0A8X6T9Z2_NEPPI|nr:hypothetical protein NPIL_667791 [Nephila pilipes]
MWKQALGDIEEDPCTSFNLLIPTATLNKGGTVCLQWLPSYVGVYGNEVAVLLEWDDSELPTAPFTELRTSEVHSLFLANINTT